MVATMQSGQTSVTGNVSAVPVKVTGTVIAARRTTAGTSTIGTVGASKVWRILSIEISSAARPSAATSNPNVLLNSVVALSLNSLGTATASGGFANSVAWEYGACPVLTAGQTVQLVTDQADICDASVVYVEEAA